MIYRVLLSLLLLIGLGDSTYLFISHIKNYTDLAYQSFCAISKAINCDTVAQSTLSIFLGLPVSLWGIFAYLFLILLSIPVIFGFVDNNRGWFLLLLISSFFSIYSIFLSIISAYFIKSYCIMCIITYAVNFALFYISYKKVASCKQNGLLHELFTDFSYISKSVATKYSISALVLCFLIIYLVMPRYWIMVPDEVSENFSHGVDQKTLDPWIGAEKPLLTIYEFTDYMCFQCRKMHIYLRKLIAAHPDKIRLVHLNYPMDHEYNSIIVPHEFHVGAGKLALISEYASERNDFWRLNDMLFNLGILRGDITLDRISETTGLSINDVSTALNNDYYRKRLDIDVLRGMKKRIMATPSYVINDVLYEGSIPKEVFMSAGIE